MHYGLVTSAALTWHRASDDVYRGGGGRDESGARKGGCVLFVLDHVQGVGDDRHVTHTEVGPARLMQLTQLFIQHRLQGAAHGTCKRCRDWQNTYTATRTPKPRVHTVKNP